MDHHGVDAHRLEQDDVLCEILRRLGVAHRMAAVFHDEGAAGVALEIGQRFDQRLGLGQHLLVLAHAGHLLHGRRAL
jgi:hypothetical protein